VPAAGERDVVVTMTLTNLSTSSLSGVVLTRSGNFDAGATSGDRAAGTDDAVWLIDDRVGGPDDPATGAMLSALTPAITHVASIELATDWTGSAGTRTGCSNRTVATPTEPADLVLRSTYFFGTIPAGGSRMAKFSSATCEGRGEGAARSSIAVPAAAAARPSQAATFDSPPTEGSP
jgi:hypothetical protein